MNKGEIWLVEIPSSNGHEQAGTRPALVLAETPTNIFQTRAIDKKRLKMKIGDLENSLLEEVKGMLRKLLQL